MTHNLPQSWSQTSIEDACQVILGQSPPGETVSTDVVGLPFFQGKAEFGDLFPTVAKWCATPNKIAEAGDILISVRAPVGPTNLASERCGIGRGLAAIRPHAEFNTRYFLFAIRFHQPQIAAMGTGSTFTAISGEQLRTFQLPVAPAAEQARIVEAIETQFSRLDAAVAGLERARANLKRYRAAVLNAACSGRLVPTEAELARSTGSSYEPTETFISRYSNPRKPVGALPLSVDYLPPDGWVVMSLDSVTTKIGDTDHKMPKDVGEGIPYVSTKNFLANGEIDYAGAKQISSSDFAALSRKIAPARDDLLISRYGTIGQIRRIRTDEPFQASYSSAIVKTFANPDLVSYLVVVLQSPKLQNEMRKHVRASSQPDLGLEYIRRLPIPTPPAPEQHRIVAEVERRLSVVDQMEASIAAGLKRAERLRQSILHTAFIGQLVPQDPADEPAAALLARIRADRAAAVTRQPTRLRKEK